MDNLCHTLVGAALGEAGLKRKTRFGNAVLMIAANLPDIDVLVFATSTPPVSFRRGWTHGIVAQLVLPVLLTAAAVAVDRLRPARARDQGSESPPRVDVWWTLLLGLAGVYSHVFLDYLNNYGVRLLAPLDWRWFYGDAVFIIDPWLWLALGAGAWLSWRRHDPAPARGALAFAAAYTIAMLLSAQAARDVVVRAWQDAHGTAPHALMVGPRPLTPFTRDVIVDAGDHYELGTFAWSGQRVTFDPEHVPKNEMLPAVAAAIGAPSIRSFLTWSRFPFWSAEPADRGTTVTVGDMRFAGFGAMRVVGPRARFAASVTVAATTDAKPND